MKQAIECQSLEDLRACIDAIDADIISLWAKRFQYVKEVPKYKNKDKESIIAIDRYNSVLQKRREIAASHGISPDIIESIYRTMLDYFISEEIKIIENK